ncbi:cytochrome b/b6 domain-containing protein [uncultured Thiohalocapsa sp.]|uniref:cytochrome b/b6 domain-containing protein n=1 Tax=uncultured Thiohalocapsa sp. TaxID=768990 RepID=UPI0025EAD9BE|nr:cytochrome b/b6 domain-containing protein [uncultured Thiohalocapsa sp.]
MPTQILAADAAPPPADAQAQNTEQVRVWDPLVRIFHWSLVGGFATAFIVEDDLLGVHVWAGYLVLALIAVRLVWGIVGTRHARFTDFVRGPRQVLGYLRESLRLAAPRHLGHNPLGGAMVVALLALVGLTGLTGMALYGAQELSGPLAGLMSGTSPAVGAGLEETHEVLANVTLLFIAAHVAGVLFSSFAHRENLIASMLTGRKRRS